MLPSSNRIPSSDIRIVLRTGRRLNAPQFQFTYRPNQLLVSRFAIVVPAKLDKRATRRNRVKRLWSEAIRLTMPTIPPGWDCVVFARSLSVGGISEAKQIVEEVLGRAGLLN